ncbi:MAG: hypothetical protein UU12_C0007G0004 [Candidatus Woesebacteria bacterium GW2011_GWA2_40_7b]|uniref:Response regulatory domain-containing protein n=1 Tax=Candidatus Woesebacteria bacterium GW2011_GWA2_40_7b TaxID=1618563 RepID=A0A0G0T270_9BACT|nr:MAG: hypothetical protein UU12_C0007G0004 [Candidatus Woesebacteria bacterium GW2011_GWA2_40_7b]
MNFRPKRIFLAEDDEKEREKFKKALQEAGHTVVIEAESREKALSLMDEALAKEVEVAVLDGYMPDKGDGQKVAAELNKILPNLIVVSVSSMFLGVWKDPNFDETKPYHPDLKNYDTNGRHEFRGPDFTADQVDWDLEKLAQWIGETEFSLPIESELKKLPTFLEFIQGSQRERK